MFSRALSDRILICSSSASNESNYRTAAYEAITAFVNIASPDCERVVQDTALTILTRMEHLLSVQNQILGVDDRNNWNDLMTNFCGVITVSLLYHPLHDQG